MAATGTATYCKEKFLKHAVGLASWTMPTSITSRGHSGDPGADGTANLTASFAGLLPSVRSVNPWVYGLDAGDFSAWGMASWPYTYWSWADESGNVLFTARVANMSSAAYWNIVIADQDDGISGTDWRYIGTMANATCNAVNTEVTGGTLTGQGTATATADPATLISCYAVTSATAIVGGTSDGYVAASIEATAFAQIGESIPAAIEAFEHRLSDVQVSMFVVG